MKIVLTEIKFESTALCPKPRQDYSATLSGPFTGVISDTSKTLSTPPCL